MADDEQKVKCPPAGAPLWMCTFADLMSLLMCFFVLLLSFSEMDKAKFKQVAGSMEKAFGVQREVKVTDSITGQLMVSTDFKTIPMDIKVMQDIVEMVSDEVSNGTVSIEYTPEGMVLRVKEAIAFDSGESVIKQQFFPILDKLGSVFAKTDTLVVVSGHTDNVPVRKGKAYQSNWGLSAARSVAVVEYWRARYKIPANRLSAIAYAEGNPLAENVTPEGRAQNRRVEFLLKSRPKGPAFDGLEGSSATP